MSNMTGPGGANSAFDIRCDSGEIARLQAEYEKKPRKPPPVDKGRPIPIPTDKSHTRRIEK